MLTVGIDYYLLCIILFGVLLILNVKGQCLLSWIKLFCLGEKQGMLVNNECRSWYNRVGDFLLSVWEEREKSYIHVVVDQ